MATGPNQHQQGIVKDKDFFALAATVVSSEKVTFKTHTHIDSPENKVYFLCSSIDSTQHQKHYFSNDPTDFLPVKAASIRSMGITIFKSKNGNIIENIETPQDITIPLSTTQEKLLFKLDKSNSDPVISDLYYKEQYKFSTTDNNDYNNIYIRQNNTTAGNIAGPSIARIHDSTKFELLKTTTIVASGNGASIDIVSTKDSIGISRMQFSSNYSNGDYIHDKHTILKIKEGTSVWFTTATVGTSTRDIFGIGVSNGDLFGYPVYYPSGDAAKSLSISINLRNYHTNFIPLTTIKSDQPDQLLELHLINLSGYRHNGADQDSSQYISGKDIIGGVCYYLSSNYTEIGYFSQPHMHSFLHQLNAINGTDINGTDINNNDIPSHYLADINTTFNSAGESLYGIKESDNRNELDDKSTFKSTIYHDSIKAAKEGDKPVFTNNPNEGEITFLPEIISIAILMAIWAMFAIYYAVYSSPHIDT